MSSWVALDWGTTNFRAYLMNNDDIIDQISTQEGMKFVNQNDFGQKIILYANFSFIILVKRRILG